MDDQTKYKINEDTLIEFFGINNYIISKDIPKKNIELVTNSSQYDYRSYTYNVKTDKDYEVRFSLYRSSIRFSHCECDKFYKYNKCEHLAAVFNEAFIVENKNDNLTLDSYYSQIAKNFLSEDIKESIGVDIIFSFAGNKTVSVKIKVGNEKKYSITSKISSFFNYYESNEGEYDLGRFFTYKPKIHKFSEQDSSILEYLFSISSANNGYYGNRSIDLTTKQLLFLLKLMKDKSYTIENLKKIGKGYEEGFPYELNLTENNEKYNFKFDIKKTNFLDMKNTIAFENSKLYFINEKMSKLVSELMENSVEEINLDKASAVSFSKAMSPLLKDNYIIEEKLEDEFKVIKPKVHLYFDFKSVIELKVIFVYNKKEINYYEKAGPFRNLEFENDVLNDLKAYGFEESKNKFILEDINKIVDFIETDIFDLKAKYEIFTSDKFDDANVVKPSGIKSQFSIGKDNIMTYKFDLDGISTKELNKVFESMENKKKYFKLKSGKILNTDDKALYELKEVCDNLNLDDYSETGVIPKYRALYLDSIKDYSIVKTNNLFKSFIKNFNENKNSDISISESDEKILRDYQLTGVKWLYNIYKCGFGGILADEMGLGKTIQTIMFIKKVLNEKPDAKILIVAPTSLIYNWEHEFYMFGSELSYKVIANNKEKRIKDLEKDVNVFITTYGLLRQDQEEYSKFNFELIIIDEAQNIKNPKAGISTALKSLNSNSKMALTGTPVENSVVEVWSIFDFLMPGYLNNLTSFQSKYNIKDMDENAREVLSNLTKLITPFILRRKKKDVLFDLPDKFENDIYLDLLPEQKKYYAMQVKKSKEEYERLVEEEGFLKARFKILQLLTKLRQLCIDPKIVFENYEDEAVKMVEILKLIQEYIDNGHKILVFSTFRTAIDILKTHLDENAISNYTINGSVPSKTRNELVNAFNKDNTNVFLITLKAGGTGLNLTSADVVIHLDLWWNPQAENQATDRAHRIGQKNKVEVVKLICKGTIEEKIVELQNKKKILNDTLIENEDAAETMLNKLDENDIKDLFKLAD